MLRAVWNWIKSLFYSCFPSLQPDEPCRETDPLLVADAIEEPVYDNSAQQNASSSQLIVRELSKPEKLSAEESALIIHHAQRGENEYIDSLSVAKQQLAYQLIKCFLIHNINQINRHMDRLVQLNPNANRLISSWHRVRSDFHNGNYSEYNILDPCEDFKSKKIDQHTSNGKLQAALVDKIIQCFNICKNMLKLNISKRHLINTHKSYTPSSKEELENEYLRNETRMNAKTLNIVNNFNRRCEEYEKENPQPERRARRGKMHGYNK